MFTPGPAVAFGVHVGQQCPVFETIIKINSASRQVTWSLDPPTRCRFTKTAALCC